MASIERVKLPRYKIQGKIPFDGRIEVVDDIVEAKSAKEANRIFNATVQDLSKRLKKTTIGKPTVTITLL